MIQRRYLHIPYMTKDGIPTYTDSELSAIHSKIWRENVGRYLFYDGSMKSSEEFLAFVKDPSVLFTVVFKEEEPVFIWYLTRMDHASTQMHFTAFPKIWGNRETLNEIGREAIQIVLFNFGFETIVGVTPSYNKLALKYVLSLGLKTVGEIPRMVYDDQTNRLVDATLTYITKEDF